MPAVMANWPAQFSEGGKKPGPPAPRIAAPGGGAPGAGELHGRRAGEDGDDREADGEVGEPAHVAEQLLRVTEAPELLRIAIEGALAHPTALLPHAGQPNRAAIVARA